LFGLMNGHTNGKVT